MAHKVTAGAQGRCKGVSRRRATPVEGRPTPTRQSEVTGVGGDGMGLGTNRALRPPKGSRRISTPSCRAAAELPPVSQHTAGARARVWEAWT